jgi:hypothetical protein
MPPIVAEQNEVLRDFTERLDQLGIPYMLTGSVAMMYYVIPRMTADIDIIIELKRDISTEIILKFEPDYYIPHGSMRSAIERNTMFNMLHEKTLVKVDCVLKKKDEFQLQSFERRKKVDFAGFDVWIISAEDLILSKLNWAKTTGSEMQLRDVANLLRSAVDLGYVKMWAVKLEIDKTLNGILESIE